MLKDTNQPPRAACDRCHRMKEKCFYSHSSNITDPNQPCTRCSRLSRSCTTTRRKQTTGRRRKTDRTSVLPRAGEEFVWDLAEPRTAPLGLTPSSTSTQQQTHRPNLAPHPSNLLLARRSSAEISLLHALFDKNRSSTNFIYRFILGPSFAEAELRGLYAMLSTFPDAAEALLSGLFACSRRFFALVQAEAGGKRVTEGEEYIYSAKAVKELRERGQGNAKNFESQRKLATDLKLVLLLALGIITFDLLDSGLHAHSICRYALGMISSSTSAMDSEAARGVRIGLEGNMLPLVHLDTCNCLVRREIPLFQLRLEEEGRRKPEGRIGVDRYIGLCVPLFALLYDVCCVSRRMRELGVDSSCGVDEAESIYRELSRIESAVRAWRPEIRKEDAVRLTSNEIQVVTTQAAVHQQAVILFLHRLRFPFGEEYDLATQMAAPILDDIQSLYGSKKEEESMPFEYRMALPFLIAAAELQDETQRTQALSLLESIMWKRTYHKAGGFLERFIRHLWDARDHGWRGHWIDLAEDRPPFVLF